MFRYFKSTDHNMSLKDVLLPLENLQQFYSLYYLVQVADGEHSFISDGLNEIFKTEYTATSIRVLLAKFSNLFGMETVSLNSLFTSLKQIASKKKQYILPPITCCLFCSFILVPHNSTQKITSYCFDSPKLLWYQDKWCKHCDINFSFRNYSNLKTNETFLYPPDIKLSFFASSSETCFDLKLLHYFDEQIIRNGVTFEGFSDSYNSLYADQLKEIRPLNRKRLSEVWYSYKIKQYLYSNEYVLPIRDFKYDSKSTELFLGPRLPTWFHSFTLKWAKTHRKNCSIQNCDTTGIYLFLL